MKKKIVFALFLTLVGTLPIFADEGDNYNNPFDDEDPWGNKSYVDTIRLATCENEPIEYEGKSFIYGSAGTYCDSVMRGDDTIHRVIIDVHPSRYLGCDMDILDFQTILWGWQRCSGTNYDRDTTITYFQYLRTVNECDSVYKLTLTYRKSINCGDNLVETFDPNTGLLSIVGFGAMYDYPFGDYSCDGVYLTSAISSLSLPDGLSNIGGNAFYDCSELTSVTIPNSVTTIGWDAFRDCRGLTSVTIGNSVESIGSSAFYNCNSLTSVTIPNSVTTIKDGAFMHCSGLTSVTIGYSVITIGGWAFNNCRGLTSITCLATEPPSLESDVFYNVPRDIPLYVPASSVFAYQAAEQWKEFEINPLVIDVNPITPDTTQLSWLPVDSASLYKLRIYSEQIELDTTLLIEADSLNGGISIPVSLAPQRVRRMPMDDIGSVVVITLEPNSGTTKETPFKVTVSTTSKNKIDILFDMDVQKGKKVFREESGSFTLNNITAIVTKTNEIKSSNRSISSGIYDLYGRHYYINQWNQLPAGIYIVREGEKASKVMKR